MIIVHQVLLKIELMIVVYLRLDGESNSLFTMKTSVRSVLHASISKMIVFSLKLANCRCSDVTFCNHNTTCFLYILFKRVVCITGVYVCEIAWSSLFITVYIYECVIHLFGLLN